MYFYTKSQVPGKLILALSFWPILICGYLHVVTSGLFHSQQIDCEIDKELLHNFCSS